jgi:hypothetical protein
VDGGVSLPKTSRIGENADISIPDRLPNSSHRVFLGDSA